MLGLTRVKTLLGDTRVKTVIVAMLGLARVKTLLGFTRVKTGRRRRARGVEPKAILAQEKEKAWEPKGKRTTGSRSTRS